MEGEEREKRYTRLPSDSVSLCAENLGIQASQEVASSVVEDVSFRIRQLTDVKASEIIDLSSKYTHFSHITYSHAHTHTLCMLELYYLCKLCSLTLTHMHRLQASSCAMPSGGDLWWRTLTEPSSGAVSRYVTESIM